MTRRLGSSHRPTSSYRTSASSRRRGHRRGWGIGRVALILLLILLLALTAGGVYLYNTPAGRGAEETTYLLIAPGSGYSQLEKQIQSKVWLRFPALFRYYAQWRGLTTAPLRSGRYAIPRGATMPELVDILQRGQQAPLTITPTALRTEAEIIDFLSSHLWLRADSLRALMHSPRMQQRYGVDAEAFRAEILRQPLTVYWDTSAEALLDSIHSGYLSFWSGARSKQAAALGLSPLQVTTLASIVESESAKSDEYRRIAGLYLNRLRQGIRLQSDPTVKFALGDFSLRRIRGEHLTVSSPYNTYQVVGLPPAPIVLPRTSTIDSVLSAEQHDYIYMCAREDFSGYHSFAPDYATHLANARRYQQELNRRGIN